MKRNPKPYITYQVRDTATNEIIKLPDDKPLRVGAYTPKAAKHQAKRLCGTALKLEAVN